MNTRSKNDRNRNGEEKHPIDADVIDDTLPKDLFISRGDLESILVELDLDAREMMRTPEEDRFEGDGRTVHLGPVDWDQALNRLLPDFDVDDSRWVETSEEIVKGLVIECHEKQAKRMHVGIDPGILQSVGAMVVTNND
jgi:hypothetical protein